MGKFLQFEDMTYEDFMKSGYRSKKQSGNENSFNAKKYFIDSDLMEKSEFKIIATYTSKKKADKDRTKVEVFMGQNKNKYNYHSEFSLRTARVGRQKWILMLGKMTEEDKMKKAKRSEASIKRNKGRKFGENKKVEEYYGGIKGGINLEQQDNWKNKKLGKLIHKNKHL